MPISNEFTSVFSKNWEINFTQCAPNGFLKYTVKVSGVENEYSSVLIVELTFDVFFTKAFKVVVLVTAIVLVPIADADAVVYR